MKKSKGLRWLVLLSVVLAAVLLFAIVAIATAASVSPTFHAGNTPSSGDLNTGDPASGVTHFTGTGSISSLAYDLTITVSAHSPQGEELAFQSNDPEVNVLKVWMKGGDNYYEYYYGPDGVQSDSGLICPPVGVNNNTPNISHVVFFFVAAPEETTTTTTEEPTTTTTTTEEPTTTTTTTEEPTTTTTTTEEPTTTTTTVGEVTTDTTVGEDTTDTTGGVTTASLIQTGGGGTAGPGAGTYALGAFALALLGGLAWSTVRPTIKRK